jgi:hypothetical protein
VFAENAPEGNVMDEGVEAFAEPMSDDDFCTDNEGIQVSASDIDREASGNDVVNNDDVIVGPIIGADEVREVLRLYDRLSRGRLSCTVLGELDSFLRLPGGYHEVPDHVCGLGPVAE